MDNEVWPEGVSMNFSSSAISFQKSVALSAVTLIDDVPELIVLPPPPLLPPAPPPAPRRRHHRPSYPPPPPELPPPLLPEPSVAEFMPMPLRERRR
jgi:hypothetical protein